MHPRRTIRPAQQLIGLVVARHMHISNMHALGYALAASATLMDYCRRLERFFRLVSQVATVTVSEQDNEVHLRFAYLTEISGEGDHFTIVGHLQPLEDHAGVEAAGIRKDDTLDIGIVRHVGATLHKEIWARAYQGLAVPAT